MGSWTIYNKNGVAKAIVKELELHDEWMAECFLTLTINSATPIQFGVGDYLDYRGERYTIEYDPNVIKRATSGTYGEGFVYDGIKFVGSQDEIVRCDFNDIVLSDNLHYTGLPTFPFYCESVDDLLDRIQANLEDLYPNQWIVIGLNTVRNSQRGSVVGRQTAFENAYKKWIDSDMTPHTDPYGKQSVAESADNITCWDALAKVHDDFGLNFIVRGKVVVVGTAGVFTANTFRYGKGNGLTEIEKVGDSSQQIVTRLRAYGSEKNLPSHYYSALNMRPYGLVSSLAADNRVVLDVLYEDRYFTTDSQTGGKSVTILVGESTASTSAYQGTNNNIVLHLEGIQVSVGDKIYFTEGVKRDMWPSDHKDYTEDALPENMAVSRLMLPMFPNTSLYNWVKAHRDAGTEYDDATGLATYHGITAYFSKEPHRPYIDSLNKAQYGVRPASIYFDGSNETDDIHPTIEGMTYNNVRIDAVYSADQISDSGVYDDSSVTVPNFHITLPDLGFNLAEVYEENASIDMKDGMCGGRSFKFANKPTQDSNGRWVCEVQRDKDENLNLFFPYCDFQITSGDHYVLTGIQMPDAYIEAAAVKLLDAALDALQKNEAPRFTYQPKIDKNFMQRQHDTASAGQSGVSLHDTLKAGDVFVFADADMGIDASIIIDVLTIKENGDNGIPTYEITLRDDKQVSTIQKIQNKIDSVINGAININSGVGGLTAQQVRSLINNYGGEQFLSKLNNDTAQGYIKMLQGLQIGASFVPDILGEGGVLRMRADGKVELVTDILYARMKAYFDSVEIREYQHTGGNRIASVAGNRMCRVEWIQLVEEEVEEETVTREVILEQTPENLENVDYFRCYFRAEDDETEVKNNWVVGDMAYCHVTSITNSSDNPEEKGLNQKHLWRLVIGRNTEGALTEDGEAWIDLSNRSTETISGTNYTGYQSGSDTPAAQDDIIQLGNVNDTTRQGAIVEFVTGTDAPSYQIYQGIGSDANNIYSLSGKNQIGFGYNTSTGRAYLNVFGDFRFGARPNTQGSYLSYNSSTGTLNIKAHVEFTNSDAELDTLVQGHQRDDSYDDTEVRGLISGLQEQIDGQIETWFYNYAPVSVDSSGAPTSTVPLNVAPYSNWDTDDKKIAHLGDTFTNNSTGYCWRFSRNSETNAFEWVIIEDSAVIAALQNASRAQETADHKRRVFLCDSTHQTPTPPYDEGDLWVNVKYPWATGETYDNEILKCVKSVPRTEEGQEVTTFSIDDWSVANGYTAKYNSIINNQYYQQLTGGTISANIQAAANAASNAATAASNAATAASNAQSSANAANNALSAWADDGKISPTEILALLNQEEDVKAEYTQILADAGRYEAITTAQKTAFTDAYNAAIAAFDYHTDLENAGEDGCIVIIEDDTDENYYGNISAYYTARQIILNLIAAAAKDYAETLAAAAADAFKSDAVYRALKSALGSKTDIVGGLVLTSLIGMRQNTGTAQSPVYTTWGGISGEYDTLAKGGGIAAWYGGDMFDKEDVDDSSSDDDSSSSSSEEEPRYATSLFRFDGSGYLASGNITWDENGQITIKNITTLSDSQNTNLLNELATFNSAFHFTTEGQGGTTILSIDPQVQFSTLHIGGNTDDYLAATRKWVGDNYISKTWFNNILKVHYKASAEGADTILSPNNNLPSGAVDVSLESVFSFWTNYAISALGQGVDGSHAIGVLDDLNDVTITDPQESQVLAYNGQRWVNAAAPETYVLPTATANALGGIKIGYDGATAKTYAVALNNDGQAYVAVPWENTTYTNGTGLTLTGTTFSISQANVSTILNLLSEGGSPAEADDYLIAQYAGGGTTTTTYYRRAVSKVVNATVVKAALGTGSGTSKYFREDGTWQTPPDTTYSNGTGIALSSNTFSINSTYQTYISHGESAYNSLSNYLLLSGGTMTGPIYIATSIGITDASSNQTMLCYHPTNSTGVSNTQWMVGAYDCEGVIRSAGALKHYRGNDGTYDIIDSKGGQTIASSLTIGANNDDYLQIGAIKIVYDSTNTALKVIKSDGTAANFYATGGIAALGSTGSGGGGGQGDVTWTLLADNTDTRQIALSHLTTALGSYATQSWVGQYYLPLSGGTLNAKLTISASAYKQNLDLYRRDGANNPVITFTNATDGYLGCIGFAGSRQQGMGKMPYVEVDGTMQILIHTGNIGSQSVNYATSAGSAPASDVYSWAKASTKPSYAFSEITGSISRDQLIDGINNLSIGGSIAEATDYCICQYAGGGTTNTTYFRRAFADIAPCINALISSTNIVNALGYTPANSTSLSNYLPLAGGTMTGVLTIKTTTYGQQLIIERANTNDAVITYRNSSGELGKMGISSQSKPYWTPDNASTYYYLLDSYNSSVSLSGSTLTVKINGTTQSLTNTWRGIQDNLTSSSNTTESLSAKQGYLLANGSARDNTKLPLTGGTMTGDLIMSGQVGVKLYQGTSWSDVNRTIPFSKTDQLTIAYVKPEFYFNPASDLLGVGSVKITTGGLLVNAGGVTIDTGGINLKSGHLWLNQQAAGSSTGGATQLVFANNNSQHVVLSSNTLRVIVNPSTSSTSGQIVLGVDGQNTTFSSSGYFGIGTSSPSYKLHVGGDIYATGGVTCASDARMKDVVGNTDLNVEQVANAPAVRFLWKKDHSLGMQVGTIAQYWQKVLPEAVTHKSDELGLQYGVAALVSAITTARKVVDHEKRITELEKECAAWKEAYSFLKKDYEELRLKIA